MTAVRRIEEELMQRLGRPPTAAELAGETGIDEPVIEDLWRAERFPASLCQPVGADGEGTLADLIPDDAQPNPRRAGRGGRPAHPGRVRARFARRAAPPRHRAALRGGRRTHPGPHQVAGELASSRERARTIETAALRRLSARPELERVGSAG